MKTKDVILYVFMILMFSSCKSVGLPPFANRHWHVDAYSGNAVGDRGMELGFGSEWMVHDTVLIQSAEQLAPYPELEKHLARGVAEFPEIEVDSVLLYVPARGLLFATYHQVRPLKPVTEIRLYNDTVPVYSEELARIFGLIHTYIEDGDWENGPADSVFTNARYKPGKKQMVLLQRVPYKNENLAVFQICRSRPKHGKWWPPYPIYPYWSVDLGDADNVEHLGLLLHAARTTAVVNLQLGLD